MAAAASVAICLALQLAALAVARPAYRSFGWRMYSRLAASWRLRPEQQERRRAEALARQGFSAAVRTDALLLTLLVLVAAVNAANPGAEASQPQPLALLVGAAVATALVCGGWLAGGWAVARGSRPPLLATAVDWAYPACYVPPLLIIFAGGLVFL